MSIKGLDFYLDPFLISKKDIIYIIGLMAIHKA